MVQTGYHRCRYLPRVIRPRPARWSSSKLHPRCDEDADDDDDDGRAADAEADLSHTAPRYHCHPEYYTLLTHFT